MQDTKQLLSFALILFMIDIVWLYGARDYHQRQIEQVQKSKLVMNPYAGMLFYVVAGLMYVTIVQKLAPNDAEKAAKYGAIIGAGMYFTFDLTNKAIFKDYTWEYAIADGVWGTMAVGLASYLTTCLFSQK